jgi:ATP-binding cassette subfamily B multidrug efflux pump
MEEQERKTLDWKLLKRLFPYLRNHSLLLGLALFFMLGVDVTDVLYPYLVKIGIDHNIAAGDIPGLLRTGWLLGLTLFGHFLCFVLFLYSVEYLGQRLLFDLRLDLFKKVLALSNDYFDTTPVGKPLTNVTNDVEAIREFISDGVVSVVSDLLKLGFIVVAMLLVNTTLALLAFITIPFFVLATAVFRKSIRSGYRETRKATTEINTSLVETITGIREINLFNHKEPSKKTFAGYNTHYRDAYLRVVHAYSLYFPVIEIISNVSMIIILLYMHSAMGYSLRVGLIFAFFSYINMFFKPLRQLAENFNMFQSAMAAAERIFKLLERNVTIMPSAHPKRIPDTPVQGKITFDQVNFAYIPGTPVLKNVSFTIQPGEKVAIVGYTGSGKTTIINLLNRLYDVQTGIILIDGVNVKEYDLRDLRTRIATVPQDIFLFTGTVAENISLHHPQITQKDIEYAAQQVYANRYIERLPNKYDENILEEGKLLSVGQKQLLSFARAFVRNPSIVVLDEATSNIDSETEFLIEAGVKNLLAGKTAIIIAHRLSTIKSVDRILVFHKGELVEEGTHQRLLQQEGLYRQLYDMQAFLLN